MSQNGSFVLISQMIPIILKENYFLTHFCIFLHHLFLEKMEKIKNFQV